MDTIIIISQKFDFDKICWTTTRLPSILEQLSYMTKGIYMLGSYNLLHQFVLICCNAKINVYTEINFSPFHSNYPIYFKNLTRQFCIHGTRVTGMKRYKEYTHLEYGTHYF